MWGWGHLSPPPILSGCADAELPSSSSSPFYHKFELVHKGHSVCTSSSSPFYHMSLFIKQSFLYKLTKRYLDTVPLICRNNNYTCSGIGFPLYPKILYFITHNDHPAAHQDHCGRCRTRTQDLCPRSPVCYQ